MPGGDAVIGAGSETRTAPGAGRRTGAENSQAWRRAVQVLFLVLNVWIGVHFILFVRYFETGGQSMRVSRPPGVEGWLPIAGLMNLKYFLYLCPYGALTGIAALFSPLRIRRDKAKCVDCGRCARACPALLPVDASTCVRSAECTGCLECAAVYPAAGALEMVWWRKRRVAAWMMAAGMAVVFFGFVGYARWSGRWSSPIPDSTYEMLLPRLDMLSHP